MVWSYNPGLSYDISRDNGLTALIDESKLGCVYRNSDAIGSAWVVDDCDYVGAHYACYNGAEWKIAQALGTSIDAGEPQDGNSASVPKVKSVDLWDPIKADGLCKDHFGPAYFFSVPVNDDENVLLGGAISGLTAAKKRTWLNYYSNTDDIPYAKNYWLGNRTGYANWFGSNPDNKAATAGVSDCTLIHRDTGLWQDANCEEIHPFACYESGDWKVTEGDGTWRAGFAACDEYGSVSLYGVPRDATENDELKIASIQNGATGTKYNDVWINRTDLAYEEFFISNQTRSAWWGAGQPTNRNNSDCALVDVNGNWIAEGCDGYLAYHACKLEGDGQWKLTKELSAGGVQKDVSALGFGYCKRLVDGSGDEVVAEYRPPNSKTDNDALAALLAPGEYVWVNYSDQLREGSWQVAIQYQDFVKLSAVEEGDAADCGYFSLATNDKGNWLAGKCFGKDGDEGVIKQGFSCTNGYEWKIATKKLSDNTSLTSYLWKDGFTACEAAFGKDYYFAAPASANQNSRLSLALQLSGGTSAWMNLNDAKSEGTWVANGPIVNLSPVLTLSPQREFPEKTAMNISVAALDPETGNNIGLTYLWSIKATRKGGDGLGTDSVIIPTLSGETTTAVTVSATTLLNDNYYIDLQLQVTDADPDNPSTTTTVIPLKVISPLRAAYDFNTYTNPRLDRSGNGYELSLNSSQVEILSHDNDLDNYFAKLDSADSFSIDGSVSGLQLDQAKDQYTVMYRFKMDSLSSPSYIGFMQKGDAGSRQPAILYNKADNKIHFANSTTNSWNEYDDSIEAVRLGQWMTVAYVKNGADSKLYVDKVELNGSFPDPAPLNVIPDKARTLVGTSTGYDTGDWVFGNIPSASEGISGGFDDIRIYDRALTVGELKTLFGDQPKGRFEFKNTQENGNENAVDGQANEISIPVSRIEGDDGVVKVVYKLASDSAELNTDFRLKAVQPESTVQADGKSGILTWGVHDVADKSFIVELLGDSLREGTETFKVELEKLGGEPELSDNNSISVNIVDKTPNPYGTISIAPTSTAPDPLINTIVEEGRNDGVITIEREGSDSLGSFDVIYEIKALTATSPADFTIEQAGFVTSGPANGVVVGQGRLNFPANVSGTAVAKQTKTISFSTVGDDGLDVDESFFVSLLKVTDPGLDTLAVPATSAILGTNKTYQQKIKDMTPGRVRFKLANSGSMDENPTSGTRSVIVELERIEGSSGAMCAGFTFSGTASGRARLSPSAEAGIDISTENADYTYISVGSDGSGAASTDIDVFWEDGVTGTKQIELQTVHNDIYNDSDNDPSNHDTNPPKVVANLTLVSKTLCNSKAAIAFVPSPTENTTSVTINDHTQAVKVTFEDGNLLDKNYEVSEIVSGGNQDVKAFANQRVGAGTPYNKNAFQVYLSRSGTADEVIHYGNLAGIQQVNFAAGTNASKTLTIPIVDNCDAADSFKLNLGLATSGGGISNAVLPNGKIDITAATTSLTITNGSKPIVFTGISRDYTGIDARIKPDWKSGDSRLYVTGNIDSADLNPEMTQMRLKAAVTHNCIDDLVFNWGYTGASPALPTGGSLPAGFSMPPSITASSDKELTNKITLPFIIKNTTLSASLTITDAEIATTYTGNTNGYAGLNYTVAVSQYFRSISNDGAGGNDCLDWDGSSSNSYRVYERACTVNSGSGIAYNPNTDQLVFHETDSSSDPFCVTYPGGRDWLRANKCGAATGQKWSVAALRVNSLDYSGQFMMEYAGEPFARTDSIGYTEGAKRWTWKYGSYLP